MTTMVGGKQVAHDAWMFKLIRPARGTGCSNVHRLIPMYGVAERKRRGTMSSERVESVFRDFQWVAPSTGASLMCARQGEICLAGESPSHGFIGKDVETGRRLGYCIF